MKKQVKNVDIFTEAAMSALEKTPELKRDTHKPVKTLPLLEGEKLESTANTVNAFKELKEAMMGEHAERFNQILGQLTGREFIKVYLTALEYFAPKIVRSSGKEEKKKDGRIEVVIKRKPKKTA